MESYKGKVCCIEKIKLKKNLYERVYLQKCSKTYQSHPV